MLGKGPGVYSQALTKEREKGFGREGGKTRLVGLFIFVLNKDRLYESLKQKGSRAFQSLQDLGRNEELLNRILKDRVAKRLRNGSGNGFEKAHI